MGMAASQARLLSITARIHDVEYQAQMIENAKVQLSTQEDAVYREYMNALDEQALVIKTPTATVPATFNNLCSHNRLDLGTLKESYAIRDKYGRLLVENDIAEGYSGFSAAGFANTARGIAAPQAFALYMMDKNNSLKVESHVTDLHNAEEEAYKRLVEDSPSANKLKDLKESLLKLVEPATDIYNTTAISKLKEDEGEEAYKKAIQTYQEQLTKYLYALYNCTYKEENDSERYYGAQLIFANVEGTGAESAKTVLPEDLDMSLFNYYVSIYNQIEQCGGCISINEFNGALGGDAANNSDWLRTKVESGEFTIEMVTDNKDGTISMSGTSPSSDTRISYVDATSIDNKKAKQLEAKYEHDLKEINTKDKKLDMSLSKLETERKALTTEYDSIKKVIDDNIERTFGIFS